MSNIMLKNLYVIADSISIHYEPYLRDFTSEYYNYDRKGNSLERTVNSFDKIGGDSNMVLEYINKLVNDGFHTDVLMLNCGLHDIKVDINSEKRQVSLEDYQKNLMKIAEICKKCSDKTVWVNTTPIDDEQHRKHSYSFQRYNSDVIMYNETADEIFINSGHNIIDLYTFSIKLGKELYCDHIHFDESIRELQGAFLAGFLISIHK